MNITELHPVRLPIAVGLLACVLATHADGQQVDGEKLKHTEGFFMLSGVPMERNKQGSVVSVVLSGNHGKDSMLKRLPEFPELEEVTLDQAKCTEIGLRHLGQLRHLKSLTLMGCGSDDTLAKILSRHKLESLTLMSDQFSDKGLQHIAKMTSLLRLNLSINLTDAGMVSLRGLKNLRELEITSGTLGDSALGNLQELRDLHVLRLDDIQITSQGLAGLTCIPNLNELHLEGSVVDDEVFAKVAECSQLKVLSISNSPITDAWARTNLASSAIGGTCVGQSED